LDEKVANASDLGAVLFEVEASKTIDVLNAPVPLTLDNYLRKTKEFIPTATSVSMSYAVYMMNGIILLMFVGRLGEAPGAAAGLANFYIAVTGVAFCSGLLAAEDTLCSQAFGAGSLERVSIIFQRSVAVMLAICIPVGLLWCFTEPLLLALHQDPEVAKLAGHFVLIYLPSLPAFLVNDALKRYLVSQGVASPTMYSTLIANIVSTSIGYFFVLHTPLKFYGMPIAMALANVLQLLVLVFWTISQKLHVPTWRRITMPELLDWKENVEFVKLGIPGALMLCAEWIGFEIHGLMSGWIGVTSLAAQSILINTNYFFFSFPLGMGVATTVMVGNEMGSGRYTEAWLSYLVNFINVEILAVLVSIILFSAHSVWGYIFTNVPEVIVLVAKTLPFMALFVCSDAAGGLGGGAIRGVGQQTKAAIVNLIAFYAIGVPAGYFFAFPIGLNWGLPGLWAGLACASYTAAFLIHLILWTGDWKQWAIKAQELAQTDSPMAPAEKVSLSDIKKLASDDFSSDQNGHVEIDSFSSNKSEDHSLDSNFAAIGEKSELDDTEAVKLDF
jgi:MATE family multidrug resistance protein